MEVEIVKLPARVEVFLKRLVRKDVWFHVQWCSAGEDRRTLSCSEFK